ncbi:plasmid mobilization protein [Aurantiacibacter sp. D1-12]|uniref:plasmid mobilization protein n=1 Tax=Aurantiacibacter sp. D1-12 TaxID=2993658 RepID=UPI00237CE618|nr:plasmid mobilization relaxosome protein MobC [Aurantiacibacter sp. D1-12]MDE1466920.1 plasmid mobilization relaxosome protein MobC [Aurantiacibacter sp. D1-12]
MARKPYDPPFSLRLSFEERARLEEQAEGMPLGAYIRERLLNDPPRRKRVSQIDRDALLRVLGKLGQSRLANNMNQIAKQANQGTLPVTPETEDALLSASEDIAEIRKALITALGMEPNP